MFVINIKMCPVFINFFLCVIFSHSHILIIYVNLLNYLFKLIILIITKNYVIKILKYLN